MFGDVGTDFGAVFGFDLIGSGMAGACCAIAPVEFIAAIAVVSRSLFFLLAAICGSVAILRMMARFRHRRPKKYSVEAG